MRGGSTDRKKLALASDRAETGDGAKLDDTGRMIEPELHRRNKRLTAGEQLGSGDGFQRELGLGERGGTAVIESVHGCLPHSAASFCDDDLIARQTACGFAGMAMFSCPSALVMALISAAGEAIAPASPQPFTPSGLDGQGVLVMVTLNDGRSCARGMQ